MKTLHLTKEELCLISIALNEYQFNLDNYHLDEMKQVSTKIDTIYKEDQMKTLTYSDSPFFSNWSQTYFTNLTLDQHIANNNWLMNTLTMLKDDGVLYVPVLDKNFNRLGEEVNNNKEDNQNGNLSKMGSKLPG